MATSGTIAIQGAKPYCISFNSEITSQTTSVLLAAIVHAIEQEQCDEIHLFLNTPGGSVPDGIAVYNSIRALPVRVVIYNMGRVDSIGNVLFQAGTERVCAKASSFMFHGVGADVSNTRLELKQLNERVKAIETDQHKISQIIARNSNLSIDDVRALFLEMEFLKAEEAVERGLADEVRDIHLPLGLPILPLVFQG